LRTVELLLEERLRKMKYHCQICDRDIDDFASLAHIKAEEYLLDLIRRDHPEWHEGKKTCNKCVEYYRKLVKENEV
jgi:hypothetical protein